MDLATMSLDEIAAEAERRKQRRQKGLPFDETPAETAEREREDDDRLERDIQRECVKLYRANGCVVYETSQKRAAKVSPGIPDLIVFHARSGTHFYHEVKTPKGELRPDQKDFREQCLSTSTPHFVGGVAAAGLVIETLLNKPSPRT